MRSSSLIYLVNNEWIYLVNFRYNPIQGIWLSSSTWRTRGGYQLYWHIPTPGESCEWRRATGAPAGLESSNQNSLYPHLLSRGRKLGSHNWDLNRLHHHPMTLNKDPGSGRESPNPGCPSRPISNHLYYAHSGSRIRLSGILAAALVCGEKEDPGPEAGRLGMVTRGSASSSGSRVQRPPAN